ncbi:MAG: hypothetical protein J0G96_07360 [Flavobacteriia bacterium]|nr:hypothetical protein [Flavobacteriia bacterium]OJX36683.1 MAG: hypothetical protein BGO87_12870 [Flavobacteriia bacterium 40-80]
MTKTNVRPRFAYDLKGYSDAVEWLKEIGEWERVSTSGFSTDGYSIIATANVIWEKRNNKACQ